VKLRDRDTQAPTTLRCKLLGHRWEQIDDTVIALQVCARKGCLAAHSPEVLEKLDEVQV
jgi:hypothetical protein